MAKGEAIAAWLCGGIDEVKIGIDVANVKECHEEKGKKKGQCGRKSSRQGKTITNGMNRRK
jgi:hypothetical protein